MTNAGKSATINSARSMAREIGVLASSTNGTPANEVALKLQKQIDELEGILEKATPNVAAIKKSLAEIGESIGQLKSKLSG